MERVLLVDDDVELSGLITQYLEPEGFAIEAVHTGEQGLRRALANEHALVILDVMLPDVQGLDVLRHLRTSSRIPVLMLTARGNAPDRVLGLELGADDYLPKPFSPHELVARIKAILRRARNASEPASTRPTQRNIVVGDLELDTGARMAKLQGENELPLTTTEFDLLTTLLRNAGEVVSREALVRAVLGRELSAYDRSIDVHVSNLRKKLGSSPGGSDRIKNMRGVGYLYALPNGQLTH